MHHRIHALVVFTLVALLAAACSSVEPGSQPSTSGASASATPTGEVQERYALQQSLDFTITLTTTSVGGNFGRLDRKHSCERGDTSPQLKWKGQPESTKSFALIMDDPASDVFGFERNVLWTHWVVYSIPTDVTELEPGQLAGELLENGAKQGTNDYERVQYNGPCPIPLLSFPPQAGIGAARASRPRMIAEERPYYFRLYALDMPVELPLGAHRDTLLEAIDGHILAAGQLAVNFKSTKSFACATPNPALCLESVRR